MKKSTWVVLIAIIIIVGRIFGKYNNIVTLDETVKESRAQVENQYQRRSDLIPNLVNTVKGFASQEESVFLGVTEARSKASQTNIDINNAESMENFKQAQGELSSALSRLLVTVEAYPQLKSDTNFLELQTQLEGTENRISVERQRYNNEVKIYNTTIRQIPTNIIANIFNFNKAELFEAEEGTEDAPEVSFE